jgi:hypothetical protein
MPATRSRTTIAAESIAGSRARSTGAEHALLICEAAVTSGRATTEERSEAEESTLVAMSNATEVEKSDDGEGHSAGGDDSADSATKKKVGQHKDTLNRENTMQRWYRRSVRHLRHQWREGAGQARARKWGSSPNLKTTACARAMS